MTSDTESMFHALSAREIESAIRSHESWVQEFRDHLNKADGDAPDLLEIMDAAHCPLGHFLASDSCLSTGETQIAHLKVLHKLFHDSAAKVAAVIHLPVKAELICQLQLELEEASKILTMALRSFAERKSSSE